MIELYQHVEGSALPAPDEMRVKLMISVIVPVYNLGQLVVRCVESIIAQEYRDLEIIIVDDGSTDGSSELCDTLAARDGRIRVIHKQNGGLSSARNAGLAASAGDYISFIDGDDYIAPEMYRILADDIEAFQADIAQCGCEIVWEDKTVLRNGTGQVYRWTRDEGIIQLLSGKLIEPSVWNKLYRRSVLDGLCFDETIKLSEDIPFNIAAFQRAATITFRDECCYKYVKREGSLTRTAFSKRNIPTIYQLKKIEESLAGESDEIRAYAKKRVLAAYISVYNHSLYAEEDFRPLRKQLRGELREELKAARGNRAVSMPQKASLWMITRVPWLYRPIEMIWRKSKWS